jgi:ATP-dependent Clp protease ATP-binding subunit ClpB
LFRQLSDKQIIKIARLQINLLTKLLEKNGVHLSVSDASIGWIAQAGYDPQYGARPVKRIIQKNVMNELSKMILAGKINRDDQILLDYRDGVLVFENR